MTARGIGTESAVAPEDAPSMQWSRAPDGAAPLFDSAEWARALAPLGASAWFGTAGTEQRIALFVWQRGPVRAGFLGFPVTPGWAVAAAPAWLATPGALPERLDLLRVNASSLDAGAPDVDSARAVVFAESVIPRLAEWPQRNARRIRKDLAHAHRHGVQLRPAAPDDARLLHAQYLQTVARHGGHTRYDQAYFRVLLELARTRADVHATIGGRAGVDAGFCIAARAGSRAYYLHAGADVRHRAWGVADALVDDAVRWAAAAGCESLSFMPSPRSQEGLVRFKQKWGEADGTWTTRDHPAGVVGRLASAWLRWRSRA